MLKRRLSRRSWTGEEKALRDYRTNKESKGIAKGPDGKIELTVIRAVGELPVHF